MSYEAYFSKQYLSILFTIVSFDKSIDSFDGIIDSFT